MTRAAAIIGRTTPTLRIRTRHSRRRRPLRQRPLRQILRSLRIRGNLRAALRQPRDQLRHREQHNYRPRVRRRSLRLRNLRNCPHPVRHLSRKPSNYRLRVRRRGRIELVVRLATIFRIRRHRCYNTWLSRCLSRFTGENNEAGSYSGLVGGTGPSGVAGSAGL